MIRPPWRSPLPVARRLGGDRELVLFGCGAAKTGTHSLAAIFESGYRTLHEPESEALCHLLVDVDEKSATARDVVRYLRERDGRLRLEVDSSRLNGLIIEALVALYPTSRFVLTVREPYGWLDSFFDHHLSRTDMSPGWARFTSSRWARYPAHAPQERVLADHGFPSLVGRLREWAERIDRVEAAVPADRLLILRTDRLDGAVPRLAAFAGAAASRLDATVAHAFPARQRFGLLAEVDHAFLDEQVERWCGPHLRRLFPDLHRS